MNGQEVIFIKEIEVEKNTRELSNDEMDEMIDKLVLDKMDKTLEGEYQIIDRKVLKKSDNNSTIDIEIFIVAEEQISEVRTATIEEDANSNKQSENTNN